MGQTKYKDPITGNYKEVYVKVTDTLPIGAIVAYSGITAPSGYLICDGSAVSRTEYADLFRAIGTSHGSGDGLTTFNLPDLRGNNIVGLDGRDTDFDTIGETGGSSSTGGSGALSYTIENFIIKASKKVAIDKGNVVDSLTGNDTDSAPSVRAVKEALQGVYSTNEVKTNKVWIDGKPIYRKVYSLTTPTIIDTSENVQNVTNLNIDTLIYDFFSIKRASNISTSSNNDNAIGFIRLNWESTGDYYSMKIKNNNYLDCAAILILEYTKTTD